MKVTNRDLEILLANKPLIFKNRDLPVKITYWLARLEEKVMKLYSEYEKEKVKCIEDFCARGEDGKRLINEKTGQYEWASDEKKDAANAKITELLNLEVEFPFNKINIDLNKLEKVVSADDILVLTPFVEFSLDETLL